MNAVQHLGLISVLAVAVSAITGRSDLSASGRAQQQSLEKAWAGVLEAEEPDNKKEYESPIQRVVRLLNEMKAQLEKEAEADEELYDKMVCWCETNEKEKTKAIADADAKIKDLTAEIEERAAKHGELSTEIEATKKLIAEETEALAKATEIREQEAGEFMQEEKDMIQAVTNLKNAILVLSKHHGGSFLQLTPQVWSSLNSVLEDVALKHEFLLGDSETARTTHASLRASLQTALISIQEGGKQGQAASLRGLQGSLDAYGEGVHNALPVEFASQLLANVAKQTMPDGSGAFVQKGAQPVAAESYTPRSGVIFGILNQLKEEFESSLSTAQKEEIKAQEDYAQLKASKEEQIAAAKEKLESMQQDHAGNKKALYDAKEDLELTRKQRAEDVEFLRNLKLTCQDLDHQMAQRSKARSEEITAVSEAIAIITDDDNADLLRKTVTLLQVDSKWNTNTEERAMRSQAATVLRKALKQPFFDDLLKSWNDRNGPANGMESPRAQLSTLVVSVQLDAFTKVKEAMDKMIQELKDQQAEEVKLKEFCTTQFNDNEKQTYEKTQEKEGLEMKIEQLVALMDRLTKEVAEAEAQIADTKLAIKKASEDREKYNAEFQTTVADQRATQAILKKALKKLAAVYKKKALLQQKHDQTPPVQFTPMKKNAGSSPVMGLIEQIIEESKAVEADAVAAEAAAQADYEKMVKDSNALIDELTAAVVSKTEEKAKAEMEKTQAEADKEATIGELESLAAYKADLHDQCDFVLKNFDIRQKARLQEIEAIQEAKAILSGMK